MNRLTAFFHWLGTPFRAACGLTRAQVRSLYSIAMLAGIVALSAESWVLLGMAKGAASGDPRWFNLLVERLRYDALLVALFALIVALTVFGADYFKARWGDKEFEAGGKGE